VAIFKYPRHFGFIIIILFGLHGVESSNKKKEKILVYSFKKKLFFLNLKFFNCFQNCK